MNPAMETAPSSPRSPSPGPLRHGRRVVLSLVGFLSLVVVASGVVILLVTLARLLDRAT